MPIPDESYSDEFYPQARADEEQTLTQEEVEFYVKYLLSKDSIQNPASMPEPPITGGPVTKARSGADA